MGRLEGRVAIVTGAGRGLGREHALFLARQGAAVVVNDLGADVLGDGADATPAEEVVSLITDEGGHAIVSGHDVADWEQAEAMVALALDVFGGLDVLVNNAGILRDRTLANMSEAEWDAVVRVHLKGHAAPTRHAVAHWKTRAKHGDIVTGSVIHTSSASGFVGNFGQANYGAAKLGVIGLSKIVALEMGGYGVRSNVIAPAARTRMGGSIPDGPVDTFPMADGNDILDPANVSPLVGWLAAADCPANDQVFQVYGDRIMVLAIPGIAADLRAGGRWTLEQLDREVPARLVEPMPLHAVLETEPAP